MRLIDTGEELKNNSITVSVWANNDGDIANLNPADSYLFTNKFDKSFKTTSDAKEWLQANNYRLIGYDTLD